MLWPLAMSSRMASISFGSPNPLSMTLAPLAASPRAIPRPIPLVEPVTMADFPDNMCTRPNRGGCLRHQGRPGWRERSRYQHAIHHDYRDAPLLATVFDRSVRYFLQTHDKSAAGLSGAPQCDAIFGDMYRPGRRAVTTMSLLF